MKRKKGISLIVLIITIVIIVILATAVILSIVNNNPIGNASEAVEKNNRAEYESELSLYIAKQYADKNGEYDPTTLNKQSDEVSKIITSLSEKDKDKEKYLILKGKLVENTKQNQVNVSYAAQNKDPDTQTEISVDKIQELCPSITEEEAKKYIIWQGELYKKEETLDGIRYVNSDGERAKFLDGETEVTEITVEFLKAFNEKQENLSEDEMLLYNGGYITGVIVTGQIAEKLESLRQKLPEGVSVYMSDGITQASDASYVCTGSQIRYSYNNDTQIVAKVIVFGDTDFSGGIEPTDLNFINSWLGGSTENKKVEQKISADVNHNKIIDNEDLDLIKKWNSKGVSEIKQKVLAIIPK